MRHIVNIKIVKPKLPLSIADLIGFTNLEYKLDEKEELQRYYNVIGQNHIPVWKEILEGRVVFFPGSDARAQKIAEQFSNWEKHGAERGITGYSGYLGDVPVFAIASGMGSGQVEIMQNELMRAMLAGAGVIIRYGSQGALKPLPTVKTGDLLLASFAVPADLSFMYMTDEQIQAGYMPEISPELLTPLAEALKDSGYLFGSENERRDNKDERPRFHVGGIHSKGLLYAQEFCVGPRGAHFERVKQLLEKTPGIYGSEMETALMYTLAERLNYLLEKFEKRHSALVGSINFFIGDSEHPFHPDASVRQKAENNFVGTVTHVAKYAYKAMKKISASA